MKNTTHINTIALNMLAKKISELFSLGLGYGV